MKTTPTLCPAKLKANLCTSVTGKLINITILLISLDPDNKNQLKASTGRKLYGHWQWALLQQHSTTQISTIIVHMYIYPLSLHT